MAKATTLRTTTTTKRKAKDDLEDESHNASKRRRQIGTLVRSSTPGASDALTGRQGSGKATDPDEDDAGFSFTRPVKAKKQTAAATRSSPRTHAKAPATHFTNATPKATKPPAESAYTGLSNGSDSFVALPVSDTPIIRKNQQLRQNGGDGRRRSSLSMRGKRASSIGNGFQSLPHPDIPASEFYKHISEDLPDPVRMKQLLAWCARRSIDDSKMRPSLHGSETDEQIQAANIARTIEEEVLKDLIDNKITTSWYHQPDQPADVLEKRPHPQNVNNATKMKEMEERIAKLRSEEETWNRLLEEHTQAQALAERSGEGDVNDKGATAIPEERFAKISEPSVDLDLLPAQEAEFMHLLSTRSTSHHKEIVPAGDDWLLAAESNIEFQIDTLLHALHQQQQYLKQAESSSGKLLESAARTMASAEQKAGEESGSKGIGTLDVLRQITRR